MGSKSITHRFEREHLDSREHWRILRIHRRYREDPGFIGINDEWRSQVSLMPDDWMGFYFGEEMSRAFKER
jgi:hypothetical protein